MEKFLFILREIGINRSEHTSNQREAGIPDFMEWIHSLTKSGNYCSGTPVAITGQYVIGEKMSKGKSLGNENERLLRFDLIMAENIDQAVSIAQTCPLVSQGTAVIEVRMIMELTR